MTDKRNSKRFNVLADPLNCRISDGAHSRVDILDISCAGIGMSSNERFSVGEALELEILIPGDDIPMFITATVTWVEKDRKVEGLYNNGLQLKDVHPSDKKRLLGYIDKRFIRLRK